MKTTIKSILFISFYLIAFYSHSYAQLRHSLYDCQVCNGCNNYTSQWQFVGHNKTENNPDWAKGQGIIVKVLADKHNTTGNTIYIGSRYGGLWRTKGADSTGNGAPHWTCLTEKLRQPGLGVNDIAIHPDSPNVIYISASLNSVGNKGKWGMGILKSVDSGKTWLSTTGLTSNFKTPNPYVVFTQGIFISPQKINGIRPVFAFAEDEIWRSMDNGTTFNKVYSLNNSKYFQDLVFLPSDPKVIIVSTNNGSNYSIGSVVLLSKDTGSTWTDITLQLGFTADSTKRQRIDLAVTLADSNLVVAAGGSFQGGIFTNQNNPSVNDYQIIKFRIFPTLKTIKIINGLSPFGNGVLDDEVLEYYRNNLIISQTDTNIIYLGGTIMIKSTNGGSSFTRLESYADTLGHFSVHCDVRSLDIMNISGNDNVFIGNDGGLNVYNNSGWKNLNGTGLGISEIYGFDINNNGNWAVIGCQDLGFYNSININANIYNNIIWKDNSNGDGFRILYDPYSSPEMMFCQDDANPTWEPALQIATIDQNTGTEIFNDFSDSKGTCERVMALDGKGTLFMNSTNNLYKLNGSSFQSIGDANSFQHTYGPISAIGISKSNDSIIYVGFANPHWHDTSLINIYKTTNYLLPNKWSPIQNFDSTVFGNSGVTDILVDPYDANCFWFSTGYSGSYTKDRIYYYNCLTNSYIIINKGLQYATGYDMNFSVWKMVFDESNGGMYIGTDIGVFYNPHPKDTSSAWICYNRNLPVCPVTDLKVNYCTRKIYASTFGRGLWECGLIDNNQKASVNINTNELLNISAGITRIFNYDITIPTGKTMTINGTVLMAPNTKLVVNEGAKLIIDGGKITCLCPHGNWGGITIFGNSGLSQNPHTNQGNVIIKNNAIIENAICGASVYWGGILQASNSTFRNCRYGVQFFKYINPNDSNTNYSNFLNDSFICSKPINNIDSFHGQGTVDFVYLWDVQGIHFMGNTFINTCSSCSLSAYGNLKANYPCKGIAGYDASFVVDKAYDLSKVYGSCDPPDLKPNQFIGLHNGICVDNHFPTRQVKIYNSKFINTSLPIECHHDYGTLIYGNNFLWNDSLRYDPFVLRPTGISLFSSNRFSILQDTMKWLSIPYYYGNTFMNGIYAENTCNDSTESVIYKNLYNASNIGSNVRAVGNFFVKNNPKNKLNCNNYSNMTIDWYMLNDSTTFSDQYGNDTTYDPGNSFTNSKTNIVNILNCIKNSSINHFNYYFIKDRKLLKVDHVKIDTAFNTNPCDNTSLCSIYPPPQEIPGLDSNIVLNKIFNLISQNDISNANNLINNLPQITTEQVHTYNFLYIIVQVLSDNRTYWQLTQTEKNSIYTIALADDEAGDYARGFLDFFCDYTFNQRNYAITDTVTDSSIYNRNKVHVDLYPNPSLSDITLSFSSEITAFNNYTVLIFDSNQTQVYSNTFPGYNTLITIARSSIGCPGRYRCVVILNNIIDTNIMFVLLPRKVHVDLYPNPSNADISLALSSEIHDYNNYTVSIYDATQYQRYSCTYSSYDTVITIPRSSIGYAGTYSCKVTLNNNVDTNISFVLTDSIEVSIYPNPTFGSITISLTGISGYSTYTVLIYDQYNNLKYQHTYNSSDNPIQVSGSYMGTAGIYTVAIIANNTVVYATFVFEVSN